MNQMHSVPVAHRGLARNDILIDLNQLNQTPEGSVAAFVNFADAVHSEKPCDSKSRPAKRFHLVSALRHDRSDMISHCISLLREVPIMLDPSNEANNREKKTRDSLLTLFSSLNLCDQSTWRIVNDVRDIVSEYEKPRSALEAQSRRLTNIVAKLWRPHGEGERLPKLGEFDKLP